MVDRAKFFSLLLLVCILFNASDSASGAEKSLRPEPVAQLARAKKLFALGQYHNEIIALDKAIEANPNSFRAYLWRADINHGMGNLQSAKRDCDRAIELEPANLGAYRRASEVAEDMDMVEAAIAYRSKAIAKGSTRARDWSDRARLYDRARKYSLAKLDRERAFELACPHDRLFMQNDLALTDLFAGINGDPHKRIASQIDKVPVVLPIAYDCGSHMAVPVVANGKKLRFMIDTGSYATILKKQSLPGVAVADKTPLVGTTAGNADLNFGFVKINRFELASLKMASVAMDVHDDASHPTLSGKLGGNLLEKFVVTIDYSKNTLALSPAMTARISQRAIVVPMWLNQHVPHCRVKLNARVSLMAMIDTGAPRGLVADALLGSLLPSKLKYTEHQRGIWLGNLLCAPVKLETLQIGNATLRPPLLDVFRAADAPNASFCMVLGNDFLSRFRTVTFDYPGKRMIFEPRNPDADSAASLYSDAKYYALRGETMNAIDALTELLRQNSGRRSEAFYRRGVLLIQLQKYAEAKTDFSEAIAINPNDAYSHVQRSWLNIVLTRYENAIDDATTAIALNPRLKSAYVQRAQAYRKLGKFQLAFDDEALAKKLPD